MSVIRFIVSVPQSEVKQTMLKIERILCPVDFSEFSAKAIEYAVSLARHYEAKLTVEHVIQPLTVSYPYYGFPETLEGVYEDLGTDARKHLQELVKGYSPDGIEPELIVNCGLVTDTILGFAEQRSVDLIVMGTHGRQGLDHLTMGSVTEKILRKSLCPVLTVRKPSHDFAKLVQGNEEPVVLRKILFCTDFSENSDRALAYALSLAGEYGAELTLLHVEAALPPSTEIQSVTEDLVLQMEAALPPDIRDWCTIHSIVRIGKPYEQIVQAALEANTDLVVMGVRGRGTIDLALFGSTTHRVIQLGTCPVLVVPI